MSRSSKHAFKTLSEAKSRNNSLLVTLLSSALVVMTITCGLQLSSLSKANANQIADSMLNSDVLSHLSKPAPVFQTNAHMCQVKSYNDMKANLMAQSEEDVEALKWFNGLCNGTYIELGGFDGKTYSNTYVFNREFDWRGLLVELVPDQYATLLKNRHNEIARLNAAVCGKRGTVHFIEREFASGVWEFAAPSFIAQWWTPRGITKEKDGKKIDCLPLQDIITENIPIYNGDTHYFDFFSLDTEGSELSILKTVDFSKTGFGVIAIEADETNERKNMAIRSLLHENGYTFVGDKKRSYWFINNQFGRIYENHIHA